MPKTLFILLSILLVTGPLVSCGATAKPTVNAEPTTTPEPTRTVEPTSISEPKSASTQPSGSTVIDAALKITGKVGTEVGWTEEQVRAMKTTNAQSTNSQGQSETYTGVLINDLLALAGPASDATTLVFVANDGHTAEVPLVDVQACADCIISFRSKGGFSTVLPGFSGEVQVKGVVEIQVK